ncbi:uncharacterized protein EDB91DRAFT_1255031 [Suillus paluster]|uniref:uncharacterized protein n=1 Tax=Suillus paluster TaxID=48578 RepID=UPI001B87D979|nr:uncharacterized protein EDB91DRAFT_1255031 [Suillus paluster]KAG1724894.1 hypothetical protein EDB91DRAFT_1255031 [Suillus paluster]
MTTTSAADSHPMPAATIVYSPGDAAATIVDSPGDASDSPPAPVVTIVYGPGDTADSLSALFEQLNISGPNAVALMVALWEFIQDTVMATVREVTAEDTVNVSPVPNEIDDSCRYHNQPASSVPVGSGGVAASSPAATVHTQVYRNIRYDVPAPNASGPYYWVTHGRRVSIFSTWQQTSLHVIGVSWASFSKSVSESSFTPPSPAVHKNCDIYDIEDAQSNLVVISTELKPLFIKMVQDFQDNREAVQSRLSKHLKTLEHIHEYLQTLDDNLGHAVAAGVMCQSKAITMATEELWCYSAMREMDEEMNPKFFRRGLLYQTITFSAEYFRLRDDTDCIVFFNNFYVCYFARWPEEERLFPGVTKLSGEQAIAVARSLRRKEKV